MESVYETKTVTIVEIMAALAAVALIAVLLISGRSPAMSEVASAETQIDFGQGERVILHAIASDCELALERNVNSNRVELHSRFFANRLPSGSIPIATFALPNFTDETTNPPLPRAENINGDESITPVTVSYYRLNAKVFRVENDPDFPAADPRNSAKLLAENVGDLELSQIISQTQNFELFSAASNDLARRFAPEPTSGTTVLRFSDLKSP